ncbi:MFS transporter [Alphaproteobacteria bacterium]|nr:MFS transporter [Alphaproteobacteria bacterium]
MSGWRDSLLVYCDKKILTILLLGFSSGLPLLLTFSTLSAWLAQDGVNRTSIGLFALVGAPYALKFLWSPLIDRLPPPLPLGRRRGWGVSIQLALIGSLALLGSCDPKENLAVMASLAVLTAFLSASQDIVIDAYRVESLNSGQQGAGAGATQTGYRIAMLASGAGALFIAHGAGWFAAYVAMAALQGVGLIVLLFAPEEPEVTITEDVLAREEQANAILMRYAGLDKRLAALASWFYGAVVCPFADFMARPRWVAIAIFIVAYKLGEAMAGVMAQPLYIDLGFSLAEIAAVSKVFGFAATVLGSLLGGIVVARYGVFPSLLLCGVLQSCGNLFYVLQVMAGHQTSFLALCVFAENLTGGMAGAALIAYLSGLCSVAYTATQYALLSSLSAMGRTMFASSGGWFAEQMGWIPFFLLTTAITIPALLLLCWMMRSPHFSPQADGGDPGNLPK